MRTPEQLQSEFAKLPSPMYQALMLAGYTSLQQLNGASATELLKLHGVGRKGIEILRELLANKGLTLKD